MDAPKILIQLDSDLQPSSFDAIVAIDAGVDRLLPYCQVDELSVQGIVHGAIFTRGPKQLHHTAIFIGGSDVSLGERLLKKTVDAFFGPLRVSVMVDSNGSNTTAAAAMLSVLGKTSIGPETQVAVLGGTGPVGRRIAQLAAKAGAIVLLGSRDAERAKRVIEQLPAEPGRIRPFEVTTHDQLESLLQQAHVVFSAGPAGVEMIPASAIDRATRPRCVVDLNAVPPLGVGGINVDDRGTERKGKHFFGAIGVGGLKMKIHRKALESLFESNDRVLDVEAIYALGKCLVGT